MVRTDRLDWTPLPVSEEPSFELVDQDAHFCWEQLGKFRVSRGVEVVVDPCPGVEERLVRLPLLGAILAVLLHQRGCLVLHASAVAIDGEAIIFVGHKGWGKSTIAATLYARGHQLIADDIVALDFNDRTAPLVLPGIPQFKLSRDAVDSSLGDDYEALTELAEGYDKRGRAVTDRFASKPLPLKSIYSLASGSSLTLKALDPQAALLTLMAHSYSARFGKQLLHGAGASKHLQQCSSVVRQVPVHRLQRPNALPMLAQVAQLIEEHLQSIDSK
jgi:hypothetical protein